MRYRALLGGFALTEEQSEQLRAEAASRSLTVDQYVRQLDADPFADAKAAEEKAARAKLSEAEIAVAVGCGVSLVDYLRFKRK